MDFDKPKVYGDTSITDGLVLYSVQYRVSKAKSGAYASLRFIVPFFVFFCIQSSIGCEKQRVVRMPADNV